MKLLPIVSHRIDPTKFSKSGICYKGFVVKVLQGVFAENFQLYSAFPLVQKYWAANGG